MPTYIRSGEPEATARAECTAVAETVRVRKRNRGIAIAEQAWRTGDHRVARWALAVTRSKTGLRRAGGDL